jgi:hypothetical protein
MSGKLLDLILCNFRIFVLDEQRIASGRPSGRSRRVGTARRERQNIALVISQHDTRRRLALVGRPHLQSHTKLSAYSISEPFLN